MKKKTTKLIVVLNVSILLAVFCRCGGSRSNPSQPSDPRPDPTSTIKPSPPKAVTPMPRPEVKIIAVRLDDTRTIKVDVKNDSDFGAIFSTSCTWDCPYGNLKNFFADVEQGTYLNADEQRTIGGGTANLGCEPLPTHLKLNCKVRWKEKRAILDEWFGEVAMK